MERPVRTIHFTNDNVRSDTMSPTLPPPPPTSPRSGEVFESALATHQKLRDLRWEIARALRSYESISTRSPAELRQSISRCSGKSPSLPRI